MDGIRNKDLSAQGNNDEILMKFFLGTLMVKWKKKMSKENNFTFYFSKNLFFIIDKHGRYILDIT